MTKRTQTELEEKIKEWKPRNINVSRRQAKLALKQTGKLSQIQPTIDAIEDASKREEVQIYWDDSQYFERNHPVLIDLATMLNMTDEELDNLFILGSQL